MADQQIHIEESVSSSRSEAERKGVMKTKKLDDVLLEVLDGTLKQVFKEAGTKVIYRYFEATREVKIKEIAEKPELFSVSLKKLLGSAAPVIEDMILKNLYAEFQTDFEDRQGHEFSCCIKQLREKYRC